MASVVSFVEVSDYHMVVCCPEYMSNFDVEAAVEVRFPSRPGTMWQALGPKDPRNVNVQCSLRANFRHVVVLLAIAVEQEKG